MFSTVLDRVTSFFDRRVLISAFFPCFVFWALTALIVVVLQMGWDAALKAWNGQSIPGEAIVLIAFLAWVTFFAFLTMVFRTGLLRLYEGYWSTIGLIGNIRNQRREHWQRCWDDLNDKNDTLLRKASDLELEVQEFKKMWKAPLRSMHQPSEGVEGRIRTYLDSLREKLQELQKHPPSDNQEVDTLKQLGKDVREQLQQINAELSEDQKKERTPLFLEFARKVKKLQELVEQRYKDVEVQRLLLHSELLLYYPPEREEIMPTRLGNVFKSSEMYPRTHYSIDADAIWSRLQSALPKEFVDPLQDAKTSLDLMITLSSFLVLFGVPLAFWVAFKWPSLFFWRLPLLMIMLTGVLLLAWLTYKTAIQATLDYGEKIKSAFDLYRWKVLEGLHLQLPTSLEQEHKVWEEVCGLLARSRRPDSRYYSYVQQEHNKTSVSTLAQDTNIPVPVKDLPSCHSIAAEDIAEALISEAQVPVDAVRTKEDLIGRLPLQALPALQPIRRPLLIDPMRLENTAAVSIQATLATALGGNLQIGDSVDIIIVPTGVKENASTASTIAPVLFENVLTLDIKPVYMNGAKEVKEVGQSFVIVLALPLNRRMEFVTNSANGTLLLSRKNVF